MLNYEGIVLRIKKIITDHEYNAASFAKKVGVQRSGISHILSGRNKPSLELLSKIQTTFEEVEFDWLLLGKNNSFENTSATLFNIPEEKSEFDQDQNSPHLLSQNSGDKKEIKKIIFIYADDSFELINKKT
tara:strand:+ start:4534 stop:4926 length:393 start_codon:yes stop_codon:yes gene_type:complete